MSETRWRVSLDNRASRGAAKLTRDLRELAKAMREVREASDGISLGSLGAAGGRRSSGGGGGRRAADEGAARAAVRARRARDEARTAERVRRATERAQAANARAEARQQRAVQVEGARRRRADIAAGRERLRALRANDVAARRAQRADERAAGRRSQSLRREAREQRDTFVSGVLGTAGVLTGIAGATIAASAAIAGMVASVASLVAGISSAVLEMIAFREASIATLGMMSGARTAQERQAVGAQEFAWARQFARETPLDVRDVIGLRTQAATAGFQGTQARDVVMAAADVGAANPTSPMAAQRFTTAIGQIRSKGRLQTEEINQLTEAGVGRDAIYAQIARARGITGTGQQVNNRIADMIRRGQITGEQGTAAVLAAVRERSGGQLGGLARSGGSTLMGTLSNLRGAFADFILGIENIENLPGLVALKKTLNAIVDLLTGTGPTAVRLRTIFAGIVDEAAQFAASIGGKGGVEAIINRAVDLFEEWYPLVRDVISAFASAGWEALVAGLGDLGNELTGVGQDRASTVAFARELGRSLGTLLAFGIQTTVALAGLAATLSIIAGRTLEVIDAVAGMLAVFGDAGGSVVDGFSEGFRERAQGALDEVRTWAADIATAAQEALGIHSPSRVFRDEVGAQIPAGVALGIDSGAGDVRRSMESLVAPQGLPGFGGAQGAALGLSGGTINVAPGAIVVQGAGRDAADIADEVLDRLVGFFERPALAAGA